MPELEDSNTIQWKEQSGGNLQAQSKPSAAVYVRDTSLTLDAAEEWQTVSLTETEINAASLFARENGAITVSFTGYVMVVAKVRFAFTGSGNPTRTIRIRATKNDNAVSWLYDSGDRDRNDNEVTTLDFSAPLKVANDDTIALEAWVSDTDMVIEPSEGNDVAAAFSIYAISEGE